ncbi:MAG TPA: hypothetical protein VMU36_11650 [Spirochaetia bacterium]|nr:hypothetical protein [Spirochaetia bacterium]
MWGSVRTHSLKALGLVVCLLFLPAAPAVCSGAGEASLSDVQRLIDEKDYPGALKLLAKIQREHPDQRDETQPLISRIIANQGKEYDEVLKELIRVLYDEQDEKQATRLIGILQKLDPPRAAVEVPKSAAYAKFLKLMDSAHDLLAQGKIPEAIDLYLLPINDPARAGFDMEKPSFEAAGYGDLVITSVRDVTARIVDTAVRARGEAPALRVAESSLSSLLSAPATAQSVARLDDVLSPLQLVRQQEGSVLSAASTLDGLRRTISDTSHAGGETYLRYLGWLCRGRAKKPPEGIAEAIRMMWAADAAAAADATAAGAKTSWSSAKGMFNQGNLAAADPNLLEAYYRGVMAAKAISLSAASLRPTAAWEFSPDDSARLRTLLGKAAVCQEEAAECSSLRDLIAHEKEAESLPSVETQDTQALTAGRARAQVLVDQANQARGEWLARVDELSRQETLGLALGPQVESARGMADRFAAFSAQISGKNLKYAVALARRQKGQLDADLSQEMKTRLSGQDRMNGTVDGKAPSQNAFLERRPGEALKLFNDAAASLDSIAAETASQRKALQADQRYAESSDIQSILADLGSTESRVAAERSELSRLTQLAQEQHEGALAKRKEADLAFADGNRALEARQFDNAKLQLGDARDLYLDSLLLEEDADVRKRYTVEIPALIARVNTTIVQQYIAEVDAQVSAGRKLFANGEFLKSYLTLETAQARWRATLGDRPNSDLDSLLESVRNALRLSGGRDLLPEDARAPAVNGFLNLANARVAQAEKLQKGDPARKSYLDDAYSNVMSALEVAPVYRAAKALQLRIRKMQAKDDATFRAEAKVEIDSIIDEYRNKKGQPERLYFALKDYQDLMPDYQPLKDTIAALEISLGFRIRPPSADEVSRSNDAFSRAQALYNPGLPDTFNLALADLDTAIRLNPSNAQAIALRRAILLRQGSPEASGISGEVFARFAESKRLYNTEDYAGAYQILLDLVNSNKRNASYPPLAQLYLLTQQKLGLK